MEPAASTLKIGIDARELCRQPAGKGQYLGRLVRLWAERPDVALIFYLRSGQQLPEELGNHSAARSVTVSARGPFWHRAVARRLRRDGVQVYFAALSYLSAWWNPVPTVTVVHDLAVFYARGVTHNRRAQLTERVALRRALRLSAKVIAVSQSTCRDLQRLSGGSSLQVQVIPEAALLHGPANASDILPRAKREAYFLYVGTLEPRKNLKTLLRAYAALPAEIRQAYRLRLAGKAGWGGEDYPALAAELGIADRVDFLGYVPDAALPDLYARATLFLYPSWYEGFGLPVMEAMAAGTPVITSNASSLPEVVGEAGLCCDPEDPTAFTAAIQQLLDPEVFHRYSLAGFHRSRQFRWDKISEQIIAVLREAAE
jgi:glycosyltransferase involved in cell wall biosynthesis